MLASRYVLDEQLAMGGMGGVHVATDERLGRRVAVKLLREDLAASPEFVERFRREAHTVAGLSHPNIAQVFDYGQDGDRHFIVMELVPGRDLARLLAERGRISPPEAVDIATQVCAALSAAHRAGVVHRDIKPGNVIVGPDGHVKVTDFGIARAMGAAPLTQTGSVMGTAQYLPPEQSRGEAVTPASDLYSLGVLIYQMLTGGVPFTGDSPVAVAVRHISEDVPAPSTTVPGLPAALDRVVSRSTAKRPADRYSSADAMAAALRESLLGPPSGAQRAHPESRPGSATTSVLPAAGSAGASVPAMPGTARLPVAEAPATRAAARHEQSTGARPPSRRWVLAGVGALALIGLVVMRAGQDGAQAPRQEPVVSSQAAPRATSEASTTPTTRPTTPTRRPTPTGPVMPNGLVGRDGGDVEDELKELGYRVEKVEFESNRPKGSVLATVPGAGRPLTEGQTIVLILSRGDGDRQGAFVVPDGLVGNRVRVVERLLRQQGVRVSTVEVASTRAAGTVVATWPAAGQTSESGRVLLVVSSGDD